MKFTLEVTGLRCSGILRTVLMTWGLFFSLSFFHLHADASQCSRNIGILPGKWNQHENGVFIFQYSLEGRHALQASAPFNGSHLPSVVADAQLQLETARAVFQMLGFQLPLESPRYTSQGATHILVRFENMRGMGLAFDEVGRLPSGECVLRIAISNRYKTGNLTPVHEYFHQIQNGYSMFKRPWFYEGAARWSESVLGNRTLVLRPLPSTQDELAALWRESYSAVTLWNALGHYCVDGGGHVALSEALRKRSYSNGEPVVLDDLLLGHRFMLRVLRALGELSDRVTPEEGVLQHRWPEALQRDAKHDAAMWQAVMQACKP